MLLAACSSKPAAEAEAAPAGAHLLSPAELARLDLRPDSVQLLPLARTLDVPGKVTVLSRSQANLSAQLPGVVQYLHAHEGERVRAGDALITVQSLELVQLQRDYLVAQAEATYLNAELERQQALMAARVGAEAERQQVVARHQQAVARYKALNEQLKLLGLNPAAYADAQQATIVSSYVIRAPLGGYVFKLPATLGMTVRVGEALIHVINLNDLHADLHLSEQDVQGVKEGMAVELRFTSGQVPLTRGRIEYLSRAMDPTERTVVAHVHITPPAGYYVLPEMSVRARIALPAQQLEPTLPAAAMVLEDSVAVVYALETTPQGTRVHPLTVREIGRVGERVALGFGAERPAAGTRFATHNVLLLKAALGGNAAE